MIFKKILIMFLLISSSLADAQYFQADLMKKRQSNKESTRWTLGDWMSQKNRISVWDQWLAMNRSANWFEMKLSGSQFEYGELLNGTVSGKTEATETAKMYQLGLWVSIFGLRGEVQDWGRLETSSAGMLSVRLFGTSLQSTHLTVNGGMQTLELETSGEKWENTFASVVLKMYFLEFIGLRGEYRKYFEKESNLGTKREGYRTRNGIFLEWGVLQLFGNYWRQPIDLTNTTETINQERDGYEFGASFIF